MHLSEMCLFFKKYTSSHGLVLCLGALFKKGVALFLEWASFHVDHLIHQFYFLTNWNVFIFFRFEMPFNIWCGGCNSMIAKGVRFNAEKKQVGNYYSTKVLYMSNITYLAFGARFEGLLCYETMTMKWAHTQCCTMLLSICTSDSF